MTMRFEILYRALVVMLLAAIVSVQFMILRRMPAPLPSLRTLRAAAPAQRADLRQRIPIVRVDGVVSVEVENSPLDVNIENTITGRGRGRSPADRRHHRSLTLALRNRSQGG